MFQLRACIFSADERKNRTLLRRHMSSTFQPLEKTVVGLARGLCAAQAFLDVNHQADVKHFDALAEQYGIQDQPLLHSLRPTRMQLVSAEVEAQVALGFQREWGGEVAARLNGMVVCSLFEARYGSTETRRNRLTLEVISVPRQSSNENNNQPQ